MMERSSQTPAIVLKTHKIADLHLGAVLLTPTEGLLSAIAHGANSQRGKLRGRIYPFATGTCYLYSNHAKQSHKITDFDLTEPHATLREDLVRYYTASLWAETVLKSYAGGDDAGPIFELLRTALALLSSRDPASATLISIQFLLRYLAANGRMPDLEYCACSGEMLEDEEPIYYLAAEAGFCGPGYGGEEAIVLRPGAARYLRHTVSLSFGRSVDVTPPSEALPRIRRFVYSAVEDLLEQPLLTLKSGAGII